MRFFWKKKQLEWSVIAKVLPVQNGMNLMIVAHTVWNAEYICGCMYIKYMHKYMEYVCDSLFGLLSRIMLISDMVVTLFIHVCHDHETTLKSVPVQWSTIFRLFMLLAWIGLSLSVCLFIFKCVHLFGPASSFYDFIQWIKAKDMNCTPAKLLLNFVQKPQ